MAVADARHAVDFAEVVVLLLDATLGLEHQDLKIADHVLEEGRALMIAINKWDVAEDPSGLFNGIREALGDGLAQVKGVPLFSVSAKTGKGLDTMLARRLRTARGLEPPRADRRAQPLVRRCAGSQPAPAPGGKRIKMRYITQIKTRPPSFVIFGSRLDCLPASYERYLVNSLRRDLGFGAVPVRLTLRSSKSPYANKD